MNEEVLGYAAFVKLVIEALEAAAVEYMIGGAVASWAWGEPRATQDVDLVADIPLEQVKQLSEELIKRDMQVPAEVILNTVLEERADLPINAIHKHSGYKANIYPYREGDELRRSALSRRKLVDLGPELGEVYLHSPEDLIIYKLWYYSLSQQTKHLRDITSILMTLGDELEFSYIEHWAEQKGVNAFWKEILERLDEYLGSEEE